MAHKTFISYKYTESRNLRDRIIIALGPDATYYNGETSESPDMSDLKTETIRKKTFRYDLCDVRYHCDYFPADERK